LSASAAKDKAGAKEEHLWIFRSGGQGVFDPGEAFFKPVHRLRQVLPVLGPGIEGGVIHLPVHAHLLDLVDRADDEADLRDSIGQWPHHYRFPLG